MTYLGKVMELAPRVALDANPLHPYTKALLSAVPIPDPKVKKSRIILKGDIPTPLNPPTGCVFHTRCPIAQFPICKDVVPPLIEHQPGQFAACHFAGEGGAGGEEQSYLTHANRWRFPACTRRSFPSLGREGCDSVTP